jgi:hypothetical protein
MAGTPGAGTVPHYRCPTTWADLAQGIESCLLVLPHKPRPAHKGRGQTAGRCPRLAEKGLPDRGSMG